MSGNHEPNDRPADVDLDRLADQLVERAVESLKVRIPDSGTIPAAAPARPAWRRLIPDAAIVIGMTLALLCILYFAGVTGAWLVGKLKHLAAVLAYGIGGAFLAFLLSWILNGAPLIRERAAKAADDSIFGIEEWRRLRALDPERPWSLEDALTTLAACLRYAGSYLGFVVLAAAAMLLAK